MNKSGDFQKDIDILSNELVSIINFPIRIVAEKSISGIVAASIFTKMFSDKNVNFSLSFADMLDDSLVKEINLDSCKTIILLGLNGDKISSIEGKKLFLISSRKLFVSDTLNKASNLEFSIASYFISKQAGYSRDCSPIVLIPFCDEMNNELLREILKEALESKKLTKAEGFNIFGSNTRQFHKVLEFSTNPFILGISGSEENAISLIKELNIGSRDNGFVALMDLEEDDVNKIISTLALSHENVKKQEIFLLSSDGPLADLREFKEFLKACVVFNKPSFGVAKCLGSKNFKNRALELLKEYKLEIINALNWYYTKSDENNILEKENLVVINYTDKLKHEVLEDVVSLISKFTPKFSEKRLVAMCHASGGRIKCCMPESCVDSVASKFFLDFNIKCFKSNHVLYFFIDSYEDTKLIELFVENLEKVRVEQIVS